MRLLRIASLHLFAATSLCSAVARPLDKVVATAHPHAYLHCQKILNGIDNAQTEQQLFNQLQALDTLEVGKLSHPFLFLAKLSHTDALKQASLPIKTYYTHQLYLLSIKVLYAQASKKQYITPAEKKEVIEHLEALHADGRTDHNSEMVNNIAAIIALVKALPQNEASMRNADNLYQLTAILLHKKNISKKELAATLQTQLTMEHDHMATYLILLELLKIHYLQQPDQQAFIPITTLLNHPELPTTVQYKLQQTLGDIFRTLMDKGKQYEAYYYMDRLLPFLPQLLAPLSSTHLLQDPDNTLLAQGLLIQWCLLSPYLYLLFDIQHTSKDSLEAKIQEKINEKDLQAWFPSFQAKLTKLGLPPSPQSSPTNTLQDILLHATYFQALNFILAQEKHAFGTEALTSTPSQHTSHPHPQDHATLTLLSEKVHAMELQIHTMLDTMQSMRKMQQEQAKSLQVIKKNTKMSEAQEAPKRFADYPWLYPPYIWLITAGLLLLLLILLIGCLVAAWRRRRR